MADLHHALGADFVTKPLSNARAFTNRFEGDDESGCADREQDCQRQRRDRNVQGRWG
jgi:hypothetical protein